MSKQGCKIELDGNIICSKPLMLTDSLSVVREQIKDRIPNPFVFFWIRKIMLFIKKMKKT